VAPGVKITDEVVIGARSSVFNSISQKGIYKGNPINKDIA
jgi:putative colanic acid biosynthesis acetyltransferase WcaF